LSILPMESTLLKWCRYVTRYRIRPVTGIRES
jgi:hypothetical protein